MLNTLCFCLFNILQTFQQTNTHTKLKNYKVKNATTKQMSSPTWAGVSWADLIGSWPNGLQTVCQPRRRGLHCLIWDAMLQKTLLSKHSRFPMSHLPVALPCSLRSSCVLVRESLERTNKLCCFALICTVIEQYLELWLGSLFPGPPQLGQCGVCQNPEEELLGVTILILNVMLKFNIKLFKS